MGRVVGDQGKLHVIAALDVDGARRVLKRTGVDSDLASGAGLGPTQGRHRQQQHDSNDQGQEQPASFVH